MSSSIAKGKPTGELNELRQRVSSLESKIGELNIVVDAILEMRDLDGRITESTELKLRECQIRNGPNDERQSNTDCRDFEGNLR